MRGELEAYGEGLADKPEILALNKIDAVGDDERAEKAAALLAASGVAPRLISGVTGEGVQDMLRTTFRAVKQHRAAEAAEETTRPDDVSAGWSPV